MLRVLFHFLNVISFFSRLDIVPKIISVKHFMFSELVSLGIGLHELIEIS